MSDSSKVERVREVEYLEKFYRIEDKAKEILDYCINYLGPLEFPNNRKQEKLYKDMLKQIQFLIETETDTD
ncbi:MAG: hypothetical protein EXR24_07210 [Ignavibacteria bacterium]|nr:hypothetical protein [Ignavibacteria bacterium]